MWQPRRARTPTSTPASFSSSLFALRWPACVCFRGSPRPPPETGSPTTSGAVSSNKSNSEPLVTSGNGRDPTMGRRQESVARSLAGRATNQVAYQFADERRAACGVSLAFRPSASRRRWIQEAGAMYCLAIGGSAASCWAHIARPPTSSQPGRQARERKSGCRRLGSQAHRLRCNDTHLLPRPTLSSST